MRFSEIEEAALGRPVLDKRNNWDVFYDMVANGKPFKLNGSEDTVVIAADPDLLQQIKTKQLPAQLPTADGNMIRISALEKTEAFGGKGAGFSTRDEDAALGSLKEMLAELKGDKPEIPMVIGNRKVMVADFVSTPGTPKSDFHAIDAAQKPVAWISHKKGSSAKDFGQWGGISDRELARVYKARPELRAEIDNFAEALVRELEEPFVMNRGITYARQLESGLLKGIAVYGIDFITGTPGPQNVDLVIQGNPMIIDGNRLSADGNVHSNGERLEGEFLPVLIARYSSDRNNFGIKGCRMSFYPESGRKVGKWI